MLGNFLVPTESRPYPVAGVFLRPISLPLIPSCGFVPASFTCKITLLLYQILPYLYQAGHEEQQQHESAISRVAILPKHSSKSKTSITHPAS